MRHVLLAAGLMAALLTTSLIGQEAKKEEIKKETPAAAAPAEAAKPAETAQPAKPAEAAKPAAAAKPVEDKVVVTVNGEKIMDSTVTAELNKRVEVMKQRMGGQEMPEDRMQMMRMRIVEMTVEQTLLAQKMKEKNFSISDEQVIAEIQKIAGGKTMEDVEKEIKGMGMTLEDLKGQIRQKMMTDKIIEAEMKDAVKPEDAKKYYDENPGQFDRPEQVQASHILVKVEQGASEDAKAEAKKKIEGLLKKVKDGGDFATLAKENSDCPSAAQGGDLGMFGRGQMVKEFEDTAFAMKPGDVSGIVETQFGYHIIKVTDKKEAGKVPFDEIKGQLEAYLKQQKQQEFWQTYREKMKADAKIEYSPEEKALQDKVQEAMKAQQQMMQQTAAPAAPAQPEQVKPEQGKAQEIKPKTEEKK